MQFTRSHLPLKTILQRPRVDKLVQAGLAHPVVAVEAGAGYGKTTAVAAALYNLPIRLVWHPLFTSDNTPALFWQRFVQAVGVEMKSTAAGLAPHEFPASTGAFAHFLRIFAGQLYNGEPVVLVFDNFDELQAAGVRGFILGLVEAELENICIVLIGSTKSGLSAQIMRHGRAYYHIGAEDLRFTQAEMEDYFTLFGLGDEGCDAAELAEDTEGWPLALHYIRLQYEREGAAGLPDGHLALAASLFENEYYLPFAPEVRRVLVELSYFSSFSPEFVKRLAGEEVEGVLEAISGHMFIFFDHRRQMFRFQKMYRAFLATKQALVPGARAREVRLLAARWYRENGYANEALLCHWHVRDYDGFTAALRLLYGKRHRVSDAACILGLLGRVPAAYRRQNPWVEFSRGYLLLNNLEVRKAREVLLGLCGRLEEDPCAHARLRGEVYALLGDISLLQNTGEFADLYKRAQPLLPEGSAVRSAGTPFVGNEDTFFLPCADAGALEEVAARMRQAAPAFDAVSNGCGAGHEWLFAAEACFNAARPEQAREYAFKAVHKAQKYRQHDIVCNAYFVLLRVAFLRGEYEQIRGVMQKLALYVETYRLDSLYELRDCIESWYYVHMGEPERSAGWIANGHIYGQAPVGTGRSHISHLQYLLAVNRYEEALGAIPGAELLFEEKRLFIGRLGVLLIKAICHLKLRQTPAALDAFHTACGMAWQNDIRAPFIECANEARALIGAARQDEGHTWNTAWLDSLYADAFVQVKQCVGLLRRHSREDETRQAPALRLTDADHQILQALSQGMTRDEIARRGGLSINTLKKRITGIYNKLGAVNRADAIRIAVMRGIL